MSAKLKAIIESYCASLPAEVDALARRQANGVFDCEAVRFTAHRLKGTARSLKLERVDVALSAVESAAREIAANPAGGDESRQESLAEEIEDLRLICATLLPSHSGLWPVALRLTSAAE